MFFCCGNPHIIYLHIVSPHKIGKWLKVSPGCQDDISSFFPDFQLMELFRVHTTPCLLRAVTWAPYGRAYGEFCNSGHFWRFPMRRSLVSRRGTLWHSNMFHNVSRVVLCGRHNTFATFSEDAFQFSWQAQHFGDLHRYGNRGKMYKTERLFKELVSQKCSTWLHHLKVRLGAEEIELSGNMYCLRQELGEIIPGAKRDSGYIRMRQLSPTDTHVLAALARILKTVYYEVHVESNVVAEWKQLCLWWRWGWDRNLRLRSRGDSHVWRTGHFKMIAWQRPIVLDQPATGDGDWTVPGHAGSWAASCCFFHLCFYLRWSETPTEKNEKWSVVSNSF